MRPLQSNIMSSLMFLVIIEQISHSIIYMVFFSIRSNDTGNKVTVNIYKIFGQEINMEYRYDI